MKMMIHRNTVEGHKSASGKALYFTARFGTSQINDRPVWLPMSQLSIGSYNDCGWAVIDIPDWLIRKNALSNASLIELQHCDF